MEKNARMRFKRSYSIGMAMTQHFYTAWVASHPSAFCETVAQNGNAGFFPADCD
ncbi:MAG: hypothetical protein ACYDDT_06370 [Sulfuricella sp.]